MKCAYIIKTFKVNLKNEAASVFACAPWIWHSNLPGKAKDAQVVKSVSWSEN